MTYTCSLKKQGFYFLQTLRAKKQGFHFETKNFKKFQKSSKMDYRDERQSGNIQMMKLMGLNTPTYWLSKMVSYILLTAINGNKLLH